MKTEGERVYLDADEAIAMLPDGEWIHTFRNPAGMMIGADWKRAEIEEAIRQSRPEVGGGFCRGMNHGIVMNHGGGWLFVATRPESEWPSHIREAA